MAGRRTNMNENALENGAKEKNGMEQLWRHRDTCRLCQSPEVEIAIPLHPIPLSTPNMCLPDADAMTRERAETERVPLDLYLCRRCGHLQLLDVIDPSIHYTNFRYKTSISVGLPEHFRIMASDVLAHAKSQTIPFVVEIGSNDGTLLRAFAECGARVLGVDPAQETAASATAAGIETLANFFSADLGAEIHRRYGPADIIVCNNTLANLDNLSDIIAGVKTVMAEDGVFVFETSYGADVVTKTLIDTVYHEYLSYFMVGPLALFLDANGLKLESADRIWTKGGSIRCRARFAASAQPPDVSVGALIAEEREAGLSSLSPYRAFSTRLSMLRRDLDAAIARAAPNGRLAAFGSSVGSVTLISQFGLDHRLSAVYDDNPLGTALAGNSRNIPITSGSALLQDQPEAVIILAWRYAERIMERHAKYLERGGRFISILPNVSVHEMHVLEPS